eukprot:1655852-Pleurochrysis_carterae.AAC.1
MHTSSGQDRGRRRAYRVVSSRSSTSGKEPKRPSAPLALVIDTWRDRSRRSAYESDWPVFIRISTSSTC